MAAPNLPGTYGGRYFGSYQDSYLYTAPATGPQTSKDATANKYVPASTAEWGSLTSFAALASGFATPTHLYNMQETSGTVQDSIVATNLPLTATNSPTYSVTVPGWARKAITGNGSTAAKLAATSSDDIATKAVLLMGYIFPSPSTTSVFNFFQHGNSTVSQPALTTPNGKLRLRTGSPLGDTVNGYADTVHPIVMLYDPVNSRNLLYTDLEKVSITFGASSGTILQFMLGLNSDANANARVLYIVEWTGVNAQRTDAEIKAMLQALLWSPAWT